jgi:AcrR family transcriptional regulator
MSSDTRPPLRADAERNRRRILDAAQELYASQGLEVSLDEIARHAGVGVGTVYRRFANREELINELFEERLAELLEIAESCLDDPDPLHAVETFLHRVIGEQANDRGLREVTLGSSHGTDRMARMRDQMMPLAQRLIGRAQAAGVIRADMAVTDLPIIAFTIANSADYTEPISPKAWTRLLTFMLDGLRTPNPTPMTAPPLTTDGVEQAMSAWKAH